MADNDHLITTSFDQTIYLLAEHVGDWEDLQSDEAGEALEEYVESLARENTSEQVVMLIGFLAIAIGHDHLHHCLHMYTEARARGN